MFDDCAIYIKRIRVINILLLIDQKKKHVGDTQIEACGHLHTAKYVLLPTFWRNKTIRSEANTH